MGKEKHAPPQYKSSEPVYRQDVHGPRSIKCVDAYQRFLSYNIIRKHESSCQNLYKTRRLETRSGTPLIGKKQ